MPEVWRQLLLPPPADKGAGRGEAQTGRRVHARSWGRASLRGRSRRAVQLARGGAQRELNIFSPWRPPSSAVDSPGCRQRAEEAPRQAGSAAWRLSAPSLHCGRTRGSKKRLLYRPRIPAAAAGGPVSAFLLCRSYGISDAMRLTFTLLTAAAASAAALRLPSQCTLPKRPSSSSRRDAVALASTSLAALLAPPLQPALADEVIAVNILNEGDKSCALCLIAKCCDRRPS